MADPIVITKSRELFELFYNRLDKAVKALDQKNRVSVELISSIENFKPHQSRGGFGFLYNGDNYSKDDSNRGPSLIMKDDTFIGVVSAIRFKAILNQAIEKYDMLPIEYPEFVVNTLSGIEIWNKRPESEGKIFPVRTELVDETEGLWKYLTTFSIPRDFFEPELQEY